jgi:hypothetical protein
MLPVFFSFFSFYLYYLLVYIYISKYTWKKKITVRDFAEESAFAFYFFN